MIEWLKDNWDKLLMVAISVIISGVIGFFAAIRSVDDKITQIRGRLTKIETVLGKDLQRPELNEKKISRIDRDVEHLKKESELDKKIDRLLDLSITNAQKEVVRELRELIKEAKK